MIVENKVAMTEVSGRRRAIAFFIVKILIVLIFPLKVFSYYYETSWYSILLQVGNNPGYLIPIVPLPGISYPNLGFNPINTLVSGFLILLPCMIFEWQLNSRPISRSIRGRVVAACILSWVISFLLLPSTDMFWGPTVLYNTVAYSPVLGISFFVILPLISRETTALSISTENRNLSYRFLTSTLKKRLRRETVLSTLLWIGLIFCPIMFFMELSPWSFSIQLMSLFYTGSVYGGGPIFWGYESLLSIEFQFYASTSLILPVVAFLSAVRFVFVRDVFRYQNGHITKSRLVSVALLGELLPSALITLFALLTFFPGGGFFPMFYPLPILPLIGFVFLRLNKFVPTKEELWQDHEHRMWFEKERTPYTPAVAEESIKVPITYLLVSYIRRRMKE
jgi:hypothetical protein